MRFILIATIGLLLSACATRFYGEAHVEGGAAGCESKCRAMGQEFVGMVIMGEYSDACVCHVPGRPMPASSAAAAVAGGVAGVAMQASQGDSQQQH